MDVETTKATERSTSMALQFCSAGQEGCLDGSRHISGYRPELALCQLTLCRWSLQCVLAEAVGTVAVTELGHDLSFNLAHALTGQAKLTADLV